MAISRVPGAALFSDLDRQGIDLQFTTTGNSLVYMDFANFRMGVNTANPRQVLDINGNLLIANGSILLSSNLTSNIGNTTAWVRNAFVDTITATSITAAGNVVASAIFTSNLYYANGAPFVAGSGNSDFISSSGSNVKVTTSYVNIAIAGSNVVSVNSSNLTLINANVVATNFIYANGVAITSPIDSALSTLTANAAVQAGNIATLFSNAAVQAGDIATLFANAGAQAGTLATLTSNAAAQAGDIATIFANLGAVSGSLATLTSNAAVQAGDIANLYANAGAQAGSITTLTSNAAVQAGDIANLYANAGAQAGSITTLTANAAAQAGDIATIFANLGAVSGSLATLTSNAAVQAGDIATLFANAGAQAGSIATLTSNAAFQAGQIASTESNIGIANTAMKGYVDGQVSTLTANAAVQAGDIATLYANAAVQAGNIATIFANLGSVSGSLATLTSNAAVQSGDIATLFANAGAQAGQLATLTSNAAVQAGDIATLFANAGAQAGDISTLYSNAAVQAGNIATIFSNLGAVSGSLATLTANAGAQAGDISNLYAIKANLASPSFTGNVNITGNLYVSGNMTVYNTNSVSLTDGMIYLADGNSGNVVDLGFVVAWTDAVRYQHGGFVRDASDGVWKLFGNVTTEPTTVVDFTNATYQDLRVGNGSFISTSVTGNVSANAVYTDFLRYANGAPYITSNTVFSTITSRQYSANTGNPYGNVDGSNTIFTIQGDATTETAIVTINGIVQLPTVAYSISGNTLTFTEAPTYGDYIDVRLVTTTTTVTGISTGNSSVTVDGANVNVTGNNLVVAGRVVASDIVVNNGAWTTFNPSWTASSSDPVINNGTITGRYRQVGKSVEVYVRISAGSSTTFGSGNYRVSLPVTPQNAYNATFNAMLLRGSSWYQGVAFSAFDANVSYVTLFYNTAAVTNTSPATWASGDAFVITGMYEAA